MLKCSDGVAEGGGVVEELFLKMIHFSVFINYCFEDIEHNTSFSFSCYLVNMWNRIPTLNITFVEVTLMNCSTFSLTNNFLIVFRFLISWFFFLSYWQKEILWILCWFQCHKIHQKLIYWMNNFLINLNICNKYHSILKKSNYWAYFLYILHLNPHVSPFINCFLHINPVL